MACRRRKPATRRRRPRDQPMQSASLLRRRRFSGASHDPNLKNRRQAGRARSGRSRDPLARRSYRLERAAARRIPAFPTARYLLNRRECWKRETERFANDPHNANPLAAGMAEFARRSRGRPGGATLAGPNVRSRERAYPRRQHGGPTTRCNAPNRSRAAAPAPRALGPAARVAHSSNATPKAALRSCWRIFRRSTQDASRRRIHRLPRVAGGGASWRAREDSNPQPPDP